MHIQARANTHLRATHAGGVARVEVHVDRVPPVVHSGTYARTAAAHCAHRTLFARRVDVLVVEAGRAGHTRLRNRWETGESRTELQSCGCIHGLKRYKCFIGTGKSK